MVVCDGGDGVEICEFQQWVGGCFYLDYVCIGVDCCFNFCQVVGFYLVYLQISVMVVNVFQQVVSVVIYIIDCYQMIVFIQQFQYGGDGGQFGGECVVVCVVFQVGDCCFQCVMGGIFVVGIFIIGMLFWCWLSKSGGGINWWYYCVMVVGEGFVMYIQGVDR